ncbi:MAG: putative E3 ubiquitin-protein ligase [Streblomastix strix]|uniref:Putative E3 ubiquitin-protein ligase n=1 Tax=Streblomastix strix TaxID=222440 RepID=A0A5J4U3R4_9EUKA|nr:MAG: putative E3 ubiquitin-protein ligase [Streblomastix strix]
MCSENHRVCKQCVKDQVIAGLGIGRVSTSCATQTNCNGFYTEKVLLQCLSNDDMFRLDNLRIGDNMKEIKNTTGFSECPYCDYKEIIVGQEEPLFWCKNLRCEKISCRKCKKVWDNNHQCGSQVQTLEDQKRIFIEQKMSQSVIRSCYKCNKQIIKTQGCNHMTCPECGAEFCYVCRQPIEHGQSSKHFRSDREQEAHIPVAVDKIEMIGNGLCWMYENSVQEDELRANRAKIQAEKEWDALHTKQGNNKGKQVNKMNKKQINDPDDSFETALQLQIEEFQNIPNPNYFPQLEPNIELILRTDSNDENNSQSQLCVFL